MTAKRETRLKLGPLGICYGTEARELHLNSEEWVLPSKLLCRCSISLTAAGGARAKTWPPQILMSDRGWKAHTHWLGMCMCLRKTLNRWNSSLIAAGGVRAGLCFGRSSCWTKAGEPILPGQKGACLPVGLSTGRIASKLQQERLGLKLDSLRI